MIVAIILKQIPPKAHSTHNISIIIIWICFFTLSDSLWAMLHHVHVSEHACHWPLPVSSSLCNKNSIYTKQSLLENVGSTTLLGWLSASRRLLYFSSCTWASHYVTRVYITSCGNPKTKPPIHRCIFHGASQTKLTGAFPHARQKVQSHQ